MRKKYGIGFFAAAAVMLIAVSGAYQISYEKAKERAAEELVTGTEQDAGPAVSTEGNALKEGCFYLMDLNGYVAVYLSDKKTAYEYTDIQMEDLPSALQKEIQNGKYIEDLETLYGFLENYTS